MAFPYAYIDLIIIPKHQESPLRALGLITAAGPLALECCPLRSLSLDEEKLMRQRPTEHLFRRPRMNSPRKGRNLIDPWARLICCHFFTMPSLHLFASLPAADTFLTNNMA